MSEGGPERVVVVDHSFHQTTRSSRFLSSVLGTSKTLWDESWTGKPHIAARTINAEAPDAVVFFQCRPKRSTLARLACRNVTWVPMRDDVRLTARSWKRLAGLGLKIGCFSQSIADFAVQQGFQAEPFQYFPPVPEQRAPHDDAPRVYWWYRRQALGLNLVRQLLPAQAPLTLVVKHAPDPGEPPLTLPDDLPASWQVELHTEWMEKTEHEALLAACSHYIAPRLVEGIGMGFLEAMALGLCVIAPDRPTMNEYIRDRHNGLLFDPDTPHAIDLNQGAALGTQARSDSVAGRAQWTTQGAESLRRFVVSAQAQRRSWWAVARGLAKPDH